MYSTALNNNVKHLICAILKIIGATNKMHTTFYLNAAKQQKSQLI